MKPSKHTVQANSIVNNIKTIYSNVEKVLTGQTDDLGVMSLSNLLDAYETSVSRKYKNKKNLKASGFNEFFSDLTSYGQLIGLSTTEGIDNKAPFSTLFLPGLITTEIANRVNHALRNVEIPSVVCEAYYCILQNNEPPDTSHKKLNSLLKKIHDNVRGDDTLTNTKAPAPKSAYATPPYRDPKFIREIEKTLVDPGEFLPSEAEPSHAEPLQVDQENSAYLKVSLPKTQLPFEITFENQKSSTGRQLFTMDKRGVLYAAAALIFGIGLGMFVTVQQRDNIQRFTPQIARLDYQNSTHDKPPSSKNNQGKTPARSPRTDLADGNELTIAKVAFPKAAPSTNQHNYLNGTASTFLGRPDNSRTLPAKSSAQITRDEEWDLTLTSIAKALLAGKKLKSAYKVGEYITDDFSRFEVLGNIAVAHANQGEVSTALAKVNTIKKDSRIFPERSNRIFILSRLSENQHEIGKSLRARQTLEEAEALANGIVLEPRKAIALSHIAAAYAAIGSDEISDSLYQQANTLLAKTLSLPERLSGNIVLAISYHRSGERSKAIQILHDSLRNSDTLSNPKERTKFQAKIALKLAKIGNANSALITAQNISSTVVRNDTLYQIAIKQIATGQLHSAKITIEQLELPEYEAKAYALLARFQKGTRFASEINDNFLHAAERARAVLDPRFKAILLSEIARYHMRGKEQRAAEELMKESLTIAHKIENPIIRDKTLASIAKNQSRGYLLTMAERTVDAIGNRPIALETLKDIQRIRRIIYALHAADAPLNI